MLESSVTGFARNTFHHNYVPINSHKKSSRRLLKPTGISESYLVLRLIINADSSITIPDTDNPESQPLDELDT